jgi:hypothetical protein
MKDMVTCQLPPLPGNGRASAARKPAPKQGKVQDLLDANFILAEDWEQLPAAAREELLAIPRPEALIPRLVEHGLLTEYQGRRIEAGSTFGLVLGNYRVLDRLGAGGMGVVFRAEHMRMRRQVAIKVLPLSPEQDQRILHRFMTEIRAIAQLQHPNIVGAIDAGELFPSDQNSPVLHFFVMEYVPGQDLEEYVKVHGPLSPAKAVD